MSEQEPRI